MPSGGERAAAVDVLAAGLGEIAERDEGIDPDRVVGAVRCPGELGGQQHAVGDQVALLFERQRAVRPPGQAVAADALGDRDAGMQAVAVLDRAVVVAVEGVDEVGVGGLELGVERIEEADLLQITLVVRRHCRCRWRRD